MSGSGRGRTVVVTGANTGIGRATALALARQGWRVYVASRSAGKGEAAVAARSWPPPVPDSVFFLPLDLADLSSVRACADAFLARGEPLHVLVNNAGVGGHAGADPAGVRADVRGQPSRALRADVGLARPAGLERAGAGGDGGQRRALLGPGHRLRRAAAAGAGHHRAARVRGLQAVQRAVLPGTGAPHGGDRGSFLCPASGRGGVGHLAAGAVAGAAADDAAHAAVDEGAATSLYCATSPRWPRTAGCSTTSALRARPARWRPRSWPGSCGERSEAWTAPYLAIIVACCGS